MQRDGAGGIGLFFDNHPGWPERTARFQALIKASPQAQAAIARIGARTELATTSTAATGPYTEPYPVTHVTTVSAERYAAARARCLARAPGEPLCDQLTADDVIRSEAVAAGAQPH
jgi:hypothetical protein